VQVQLRFMFRVSRSRWIRRGGVGVAGRVALSEYLSRREAGECGDWREMRTWGRVLQLGIGTVLCILWG
jgi:hypothetical protein